MLAQPPPGQKTAPRTRLLRLQSARLLPGCGRTGWVHARVVAATESGVSFFVLGGEFQRAVRAAGLLRPAGFPDAVFNRTAAAVGRGRRAGDELVRAGGVRAAGGGRHAGGSLRISPGAGSGLCAGGNGLLFAGFRIGSMDATGAAVSLGVRGGAGILLLTALGPALVKP